MFYSKVTSSTFGKHQCTNPQNLHYHFCCWILSDRSIQLDILANDRILTYNKFRNIMKICPLHVCMPTGSLLYYHPCHTVWDNKHLVIWLFQSFVDSKEPVYYQLMLFLGNQQSFFTALVRIMEITSLNELLLYHNQLVNKPWLPARQCRLLGNQWFQTGQGVNIHNLVSSQCLYKPSSYNTQSSGLNYIFPNWAELPE